MTLFRRITAPEPTPTWGVTSAVVTLLLNLAFMTVVGGSVGVALLQARPEALTLGWIVGALLTLAWVYFRAGQPAEWQNFYNPFVGRVPLLIAFGTGFAAAVSLDLIGLLGGGQFVNAPQLLFLTPNSGLLAWALSALFVLLLQPVSEELLFRGMIYSTLRARLNVWLTVASTSLLYAGFHLAVYPLHPSGWWYSVAEPLVMGVIFGLIRAGDGSPRGALAAHVGAGIFALLKVGLLG